MNSSKPILNSNWKLVSELEDLTNLKEEEENLFEEDEVSFPFLFFKYISKQNKTKNKIK